MFDLAIDLGANELCFRQRAFRERKERHVKELEAKLTSLQNQSSTLNGENERLRRELAKIATENEILRATSGSSFNGPTPFLEEPDELVDLWVSCQPALVLKVILQAVIQRQTWALTRNMPTSAH
jgi:hypothetical protein